MLGALLSEAVRHAFLAAAALAAALALGAPLGVLASFDSPVRGVILALAALGRTLPSIALLMLLLPYLGVGVAPALVALVLLALPPIVVNVDLGIRGVSAGALDAAIGLGMTPAQRFVRIVIPSALPVAVAGVRTASVEVIGSATLATFIGGGGLGDGIVQGLQTADVPLLVAATVIVAAMAFAADAAFGRLASRLEIA
jgi:osmoprotectant transport system permease protein